MIIRAMRAVATSGQADAERTSGEVTPGRWRSYHPCVGLPRVISRPLRVVVPLGTRPEIVKLAPVIAEASRRGHEVRTIATGQHYDAALCDDFLDELGVEPAERWTLPSGSAERLATMLSSSIESLARWRPDAVLLLGDTNTVPVFCLAARWARIPVAHIEAGMRSFNETSAEEVNRKVAAATASLHLAPTELSARFLAAEGVDTARIRVVGNPAIDVLRAHGATALPPHERKGVLLTAHRATNVDDPVRLEQLALLARRLAEALPPVKFPMHPRTAARLAEAGLLGALEATEGLVVMPPQPYGAMIDALCKAAVVVTDSGGLQEEASWLGVPAVVLRRSTPRWEGVEAGAAVLTGLDAGNALASAVAFAAPEEQARVSRIACPYGDGHASERIADALGEAAAAGLLDLVEPDFTDGSLPELAGQPYAEPLAGRPYAEPLSARPLQDIPG